MRIYGIFRGFPGLGRVMSGISLLTSLKKLGHEVKAYSYLQGVDALKCHGVETFLDDQPDKHQIMALGLNPIGNIAEKLITAIEDDKPDILLVDGEPLLVSTLAMIIDRKKIVSLLNPADLYNKSLPEFSIKFFHKHYLAAGKAIVHGIDKKNIVIPDDCNGCEIIALNTILRESVINIENNDRSKIISILGGGSNNASDSFVNSTIAMGNKIIDMAKMIPDEQFVLFCNDKNIENGLKDYKDINNISIVSSYATPKELYNNAKVVICRAGRNTISEVLYLDIPTILMSTCGDFRSEEQNRNMEQVCELRPNYLFKVSESDTNATMYDCLKKAIDSGKSNIEYIPGNEEAISFILGE